MFIVDPKEPRAQADELVMVMNAFDTNFDFGNEIYAVNTVGFHYLNSPIKVKRDALVRIYLVNVLEYDPINSFHLHANFFHYFPTGTSLVPAEYTDTISQVQGQRGILELKFPYPGKYMFHAHKTGIRRAGLDGLLRGRGLMNAEAAPPETSGARLWLLGLIPLALMAGIVVLFAALGAPGSQSGAARPSRTWRSTRSPSTPESSS